MSEDAVPGVPVAHGPPVGQPPARSRGLISLLAENCTVCMLCVRECPDWCLHIEGHTETVTPAAGGRDRQRHVLDRFAIDYGLCMYCGICVEVCPFDALHWSPSLVPLATDRAALTAEREQLEQWSAQVPPPAALEAGAPAAKEIAALDRPEQRLPGGR